MASGADSSSPPRGASPGRRALRRFRRNRSAVVAALVLLGLWVLAGLAGFFAPYHYRTHRDRTPYHPPNLRIVDEDGAVHLQPFVHPSVPTRDEFGGLRYDPDPNRRFPVRFLVRGDRYLLFGSIPCDLHLFGLGSPRPDAPAVHLLGSDYRGRDVFSRLIYGAGVSLSIGLLGVLVSFAVGILVGGISGYFGGAIDAALQRVCETMMILPGFYVVLAVRAAMPSTADWSSSKVYLVVVLCVALLGWAAIARTIRGQALSLREREFVLAARAIGRGPFSTLLRHVLPHTLPFAIVAASVAIPGYILMESALSMVGLGIQEPEPSWGNMLQDAMNVGHLQLHPWILAPGLALSVAVTAFQYLGEGLRDAIDPQGPEGGRG
ncbi:MAG TPA: ABC transporter permease [Planctomycetota bacterium]|jgi:peptide/nickel transport system permease protein|nr:ABC transporter permease [Planctomycetota bacterium]